MITDVYGNILYPCCLKSDERFRDKCGGTTIAFRGWISRRQADYDFNSICDNAERHDFDPAYCRELEDRTE